MKQTKLHHLVRRTAAALLTAAVVCGGAFSVRASAGTQLNLGSKFDQYVTNAVSDILAGVVSIPKEYRLNDADLVAPKPRQDCYGETTDPEEMCALLEAAAPLLDGQDTLFSPDLELREGTTVRYYLDETIFAVTWKQVIDMSVYTFSEVKIAHASQFRRFYAGGSFGSNTLSTTTEMAKSVNAVAASSGDYYVYRPNGISVNNGIVYRIDRDRILDTCFVDEEGDLILVPRRTLSTQEDVEQFVKEKHIRFSVAFGPILVKDGEECTPKTYSVGEIDEGLSRAAICQLDKLHYLTVTVNIGDHAPSMPTIWTFGQRLHQLGIPNAYSLDGGQTATIVLGNTLINDVSYGDERKISDMLYFATAFPGEK